MLDTWRSLERTLRRYSPHKLRSLNGPALTRDLRRLEDTLGTRLPRLFSDSYRIHDGQTAIGIEDMLYEHEELLSIDQIIREWQEWQALHDGGAFAYRMPVAARGVRPLWWHPLWIPITSNGAGGYHCIDLDPAEGGRRGQVIHVDRRGAARMVVARSMRTLLLSWTEAD